MKASVIIAALLISLGVFGLVYGGFNYVSDTHDADVGSLHLSVTDREYLNIPAWAGVALIALGGGLLLWRRKS